MDTADNTPEQRPLDRQPNGRFAPGNQSGASARFQRGNKFGQRGGGVKHYQVRLQREMAKCATNEDIRRVYARLLADALNGNVQAAKLLLAYVCGQPGVEVEVKPGRDGDEDDMDVVAQRMADFERIMQVCREKRDAEAKLD